MGKQLVIDSDILNKKLNEAADANTPHESYLVLASFLEKFLTNNNEPKLDNKDLEE